MKTVKEVMRKPPAHWVGDGFNVFPVFDNKAFTADFSPFLMFDYGAPKIFPPTSKKLGVGQHPHRGFETVTIAFQGEIEHSDNKGNTGVIGPGDVQWMTAARGIVHEEHHSRKFAKEGGTLEMCQLWVNLPAAHKMNKAHYQPIMSADIPVVDLVCVDGAEAPEAAVDVDGSSSSSSSSTPAEARSTARVIAGSYNGVAGPATTHTPIEVWDVELNSKKKTFQLDTPTGHNTLVFVRRGAVEIAGEKLGLADVAILSKTGTSIHVKAAEKNTKLLVLSGQPIDEPIAARGPFVMNTQAELQQAVRDYQSGKF